MLIFEVIGLQEGGAMKNSAGGLRLPGLNEPAVVGVLKAVSGWTATTVVSKENWPYLVLGAPQMIFHHLLEHSQSFQFLLSSLAARTQPL